MYIYPWVFMGINNNIASYYRSTDFAPQITEVVVNYITSLRCTNISS